MKAISDELGLCCPYLFDTLGFALVEETFDQDSFGNSTAVLESRDLRLRFVRDRGQVFADIGSMVEPELWWDITLIVPLLGSRQPEQPEVSEVERLATYIRDNYQSLIKLFSRDRFYGTKLKLERLRKDRSEQIFKSFPV